eukprot:CFRG4319T1
MVKTPVHVHGYNKENMPNQMHSNLNRLSDDMESSSQLKVVHSKTAILLFHPHPKLGGNSNNNVISAVGRNLAINGYTTLAINSRGVNGSTGSPTWRGSNERKDLAAVCEYMVGRGFENLVLFGYSFGACVTASCEYSRTDVVKGVVLVSYPCGWTSSALLGHHLPEAKKLAKPKLWITGENDQLHTVNQSRSVFDRLRGNNNTFVTVPNADHTWQGSEKIVCNQVIRWLNTILQCSL